MKNVMHVKVSPLLSTIQAVFVVGWVFKANNFCLHQPCPQDDDSTMLTEEGRLQCIKKVLHSERLLGGLKYPFQSFKDCETVGATLAVSQNVIALDGRESRQDGKIAPWFCLA